LCCLCLLHSACLRFLFLSSPPTPLYTLSLHDALPISPDEDASRVSSSAIRAATCSSDSPLASWLAARAMRNCQRRSWSISRPGRSEERRVGKGRAGGRVRRACEGGTRASAADGDCVAG